MASSKSKISITLISIMSRVTYGFTGQYPQHILSETSTQLQMSESTMKKGTKMSKSIPFLRCPDYLDGSLAGDVGFDPLGLGRNEQGVLEMREAEIKHARLAMLVC